MRKSIRTNDGETLWLVSFDNDQHRPIYVIAPNKRKATSVARRYFDRQKYEFNWTECASVEDTGKTLINSAIDTDNPPYCAIEAKKYQMKMYEKRVNQCGSKGVYSRTLYY